MTLEQRERQLKRAIAQGQASVCAVISKTDTMIVLERLDSLLAWLDDPKTMRVRATIVNPGELHGDDIVEPGNFVWWTPAYPADFIEATCLDEQARRENETIRKALPTLKEPRNGHEVIILPEKATPTKKREWLQ
jgi:hypothetical protein